jgi:hypothetical protein
VSTLPLFVCVRTQLFVVVAEHWFVTHEPAPLHVPPPVHAVALEGYTHSPEELQEVAPHVPPVMQKLAQQSPMQVPLEHCEFPVQAWPLASVVVTHVPEEHVWPEVQTIPHFPQLFESVCVFVQILLPQACSPATQALHTPPTQMLL